uniref:Secreted protein n=1 Tax=Anopheles dirus TaxID=7168 RepID=A0A182NZ42_9DIPT
MVSAFDHVWTLVPLAVIITLRLDGVGGAPMRSIGYGGGGGREGCQRSSPELRECVGASVQQFVNFMSSGKISPKHTITPFDPLHLPNMTIFQEKRVKAVYVNRYLVGLKNAFVQDVRMDIEKLEFNLTALMPALEMLGIFSTERLEDHQATENSILTFSIRNTLVDFTATGTLYSATDASGTPSKYLRLQLGISSMSIASYVLSEHLGSDQRPAGGNSSSSTPVAPAKFMRLIEKDLRVQLIKRMQHIANEALALTPFTKLFPV